MGALNAAPDQNPFAFECSQDYRTAAMRFKTSGQNLVNPGAIITATPQKIILFGRHVHAPILLFFPVFHTWQPKANCPIF
jgi:hypothetical protein